MAALIALLAALAGVFLPGSGHAQAIAPLTAADILERPGVDLSDPQSRAAVVQEIRQLSEQRREQARDRALARGLPLREVRPDGGVREIADFDGDQPLYRHTHNANATISTAAHTARTTYGLSGSGLTIGMWDGGSGLADHQEFGGRMVVKDGSAAINHATHVGGTLIASGVQTNARGMAPAAMVDSYDWNSDTSEMTSRAASAPAQAGRIYLSNHSYGYISGWHQVNGGSPYRQWEWYGNGSNASGTEWDFGRYNTQTRDQDSLAYNAPYYLIFRSAGNERTNNPSTGSSIALSPGSSTVVSYDPALHPAGDGNYLGGFGTIGYESLAKNVMTVGSVADAVTNGTRDINKAAISSFSSWGPTDDGRIKPDVVANGDLLYSSLAGGNATYGNSTGTSMSTPNACGSAALLVEQYQTRFPGQAMRASTLKALLIHTADDRGNPGPDYKFGWGLVNTKAAADVIQRYYITPEIPSIIESSVSTTINSRTHSFQWDGVSPLRATLCWTDPAGTATSTAVTDERTAKLVNNLNLKLIAPGGTEHFPYVMPFVGTWTQASMNANAVTGINHTDNVEQVYLAAPAISGNWQALVNFSGALTNTTQNYSLILSGTAPSGPLPPSVLAVSPDSGDALESTTVPITISGTSFAAGADVKFTLAGQSDVYATVQSVSSATISCTLDLSGMAVGLWNVVVTNPDSQTGTLANAFAVIGTIWSRNFDSGGAPGWSTDANIGSSNWALVTSQSHTPSTSWFASGPASRNTDNLASESIAIPADAIRMKLSFWHKFNLETGNDGGVLEFSINGGTWFRVNNTGSAEEIIVGDYNITLNDPKGDPKNKNEFAASPAWSGNSGSNFTQVVVALKDTAKYAGKSLRARWRLATNSSVASPGGWHVDSLRLSGAGGVVNQPPSILTEAAAVPALVTGTSTDLTVTATDDAGETSLTYTWAVTGGTFERPVSLSENGNNAAKNTTGTFAISGNYSFEVTVRDPAGATATSSVGVVVQATPAGLTVTPESGSLVFGETLQFQASVIDQFSDPLTPQPEISWSANGGGSIDASGLFTATAAGGPYTITAQSGELSSNASITITPAPATITLGNLTQTYDGEPKPVSVTTDPAGRSHIVTYDTSETPPTLVGFYTVVATITDPNYQGQTTGTLVIEAADDGYGDWAATYGLVGEDADPAADPDGDGMTNAIERAFDFDPTDPNSRLKLALDGIGAGIVSLRVNKVIPSGSFLLQSCTELDGGWDEGLPLEVTETTTDFPIEVPANGTRCFYRLFYQAPPES